MRVWVPWENKVSERTLVHGLFCPGPSVEKRFDLGDGGRQTQELKRGGRDSHKTVAPPAPRPI